MRVIGQTIRHGAMALATAAVVAVAAAPAALTKPPDVWWETADRPAPVRAQPTRLNFGPQPVGSSTTRSVTLTNVTDEPAIVGFLTIPEPASPSFAVVDQCVAPTVPNDPPNESAVLAPGTSCTFDVTFTPSAAEQNSVVELTILYQAFPGETAEPTDEFYSVVVRAVVR